MMAVLLAGIPQSTIDTLSLIMHANFEPPQDGLDNWTIPRPSRQEESLYSNTNRNSMLFFRATGLKEGSEEQKALKTTMQALHSRYLEPFKYLEEQEPDKVKQLIDRARIELPWLKKYEDCWPALIYLKRYVDTRRPYLGCPRYTRERKKAIVSKKKLQPGGTTCTRRNLTDVLENDDTTAVREFLASLQPSLEHRLDAFIGLGIKDEQTLQAFLLWPHDAQAQLVDEAVDVLQITSLERKGLLIGCGFVKQKVLRESSKVANGRYL